MAHVILLGGGGGGGFYFWEGVGVCVAVTSHVKDGYEAETNWVVSCLAKIKTRLRNRFSKHSE